MSRGQKPVLMCWVVINSIGPVQLVNCSQLDPALELSALGSLSTHNNYTPQVFREQHWVHVSCGRPCSCVPVYLRPMFQVYEWYMWSFHSFNVFLLTVYHMCQQYTVQFRLRMGPSTRIVISETTSCLILGGVV